MKRISLITVIIILIVLSINIILPFTSVLALTDKEVFEGIIYADGFSTTTIRDKADVYEGVTKWGHVLIPVEYVITGMDEKTIYFTVDGVDYQYSIGNGDGQLYGLLMDDYEILYTDNTMTQQLGGNVIAPVEASPYMNKNIGYMVFSIIVDSGSPPTIAGNDFQYEFYKLDENGEKTSVLDEEEQKQSFDDDYITEAEKKEQQKIEEEKFKAGRFESLMTRIFAGIADLLIRALRALFGKELSIDTVIFNQYHGTILDFFGDKGEFNNIISGVINTWYRNFTNIALLIYMLILVYMGIKAMMASGTPEQKKFKLFIESWVIGVGILFFAPFIMKYCIEINNTLVSFIAKGKQQQLTSYYNTDLEFDFGKPGEDQRTVYIEKLLGEYEGAKQDAADSQAELEAAENEIDEANEQIKKIGGVAEDYLRARGEVYREAKEEYDKIGGVNSIPPKDFLDRMDQGKRDLLYAYIYENYGEDTNIDEYRQDITKMQEVFKSVLADEEAAKQNLAQAEQKYQAALEKVQNIKKQIDAFNTDLMGAMAAEAGKTGRFVYLLIFYILVFQMIFVMILYYKRLFMVAALIAIFPLVMITYAIDKSGDGSAQTLSTWFREFTVNIFIQTFHAIIYVVLIDAGITIYIESEGENWLFFLGAIMFIFPVERIMRNIFGLKASTLYELNNSVSKTVGAVGLGLAATRAFRNGETEKEKKAKAKAKKKKEQYKEKKDERARNKQTRRSMERDIRNSRMSSVNSFTRARYGIMNAGTAVKSGMHKVGQVKNKAIKGFKNFTEQHKKVFKAVKTGAGVIRKTAGIAAGATVAVGGGLDTGSITAATGVIQMAGGFSGHSSDEKKVKRNQGAYSRPDRQRSSLSNRMQEGIRDRNRETQSSRGASQPNLSRGGNSRRDGEDRVSNREVNVNRDIRITERDERN